MRFPAPLLILLLAACRPSLDTVEPRYLAVGGGDTAVMARPQLDVVVRMTGDSTGFNPFDLMQLVVNGTDEAPGMVIGGNWAVYTLPAPGDATFDLALNRRAGAPLDTGTIVTQPYAGPVLASVAPDTAMLGATVTITGSGFSAGPVRVFFGGIEGSVTGSDDGSITAVVPQGAFPGLVWVLVGDDAAEGVVGFQPLDASGAPVPPPDDKHIHAVFPAAAPVEAVIRIYGFDWDDDHRVEFGGQNSQRILNFQRITVDPVGELLFCYGVAGANTPPRRTNIRLKENDDSTNELPFVVLE